MSDYLEICLRQLDGIEAKNKEAPLGDEKARTDWICQRIREMVIATSEQRAKGKPTKIFEDRIEQAFRKL